MSLMSFGSTLAAPGMPTASVPLAALMEILHRIHFFTFHGVFIHGCFICLCPHGIPWFAHRKHSMEFPRNGIAAFPWGLRGFPWNEYHLVFPRNIRGNPRTPHEITVVLFLGNSVEYLRCRSRVIRRGKKHTKTSMETPSWASAHMGKWGQLIPPEKWMKN